MVGPSSLEISPLIDRIELLRVRLPLREPFVAAHGVEAERDVVLVHLIGAGRDGWGECSTLSAPTYTAEHTEQAWSTLRDEIAPVVLRERGGSVEPAVDRPMAWCAVEVALADLTDRWPFGEAARRAARGAVRSTCVLGQADSVGALRARVSRAVASGCRSLKLKIQPGWDVEPLTAARDVAPDCRLAADANGSYERVGVDGLSERDLSRFGLDYLEQPFAAGNLDAHADAVRRLRVPIAVDESVSTADDLAAVIERRAANVINIKPARLGGLGPAHRIAMTAAEHEMRPFVGGMLETGVGRSAALRLAALPIFALPTDLGPSSRYFEEDITEPIELESPGMVIVPGDATLVRRPRPERLAAVVSDQVVIG